YVLTLRENIRHVRMQPAQLAIPVMDAFTTNVLAEKLNSNDVNEVVYALDLFEMAQHLNAHSAIRNLLEHPSPHVRKRAVSILNNAGDLSVRHQIGGLIKDSSLDVRTEALLYLSRHEAMDPLSYVQTTGDFADFSVR